MTYKSLLRHSVLEVFQPAPCYDTVESSDFTALDTDFHRCDSIVLKVLCD